jgi:hypothetical protein
MRLPRTLIEFSERFPDEASCWAALNEARWPRGFVCPRCQAHESSWVAARGLRQCGRCRYQVSVTAGTALHRTRTPLRVWLFGVFLVTRRKTGVSALQFQRDTGLASYQTAWTLLHKIRAALAAGSGEPLRGCVEIDETYVGATREAGAFLGRRAGRKTIVACAVEQRGEHAGAVRLAVVPEVSFAGGLGPFVRAAVDRAEGRIRTDGYGSYKPLAREGFHHEPRVQGHRRNAKAILPWVHLVFTNLKAWLRGTFHGVSKKHMQTYLDEFAYRFNRRGSQDALLPDALGLLTRVPPLTYRSLAAEPVG